MAETPRVVVLGLGFAGQGTLEALIDTPVQVTLIDKNDYHTFQPLLYQVATDELERGTVGFPARDMLHHHPTMLFHQTAVTGVDVEKKVVTLQNMWDSAPTRTSLAFPARRNMPFRSTPWRTPSGSRITS